MRKPKLSQNLMAVVARRRRRKMRSQGLCVRCSKSSPDSNYCVSCRKKAKDYYEDQRPSDKHACRKCPKKLTDRRRRYCDTCLPIHKKDRILKYSKERYEHSLTNKLCIRCGRNPIDSDSKSRCTQCMRYARDRHVKKDKKLPKKIKK